MIEIDHEWRLPPAQPVLPGGELHIWRMALEQPPDRIDALARLLSPDEQARSDRFHFERDRRRFIVSHSGLRQILGRYLNLASHNIRFKPGPYGKPYLAEEFSGSGLQFNLAHSDELALCAVTRTHEVGVDLEHVRPLPDLRQIAARYFVTAEYQALCSLPEHQQTRAVFNGWTRKEACLKATGGGLAQGLDQFQVSVRPDEPPQVLTIADSPPAAIRWSLISFEPAPRYIAAVAIGCLTEDDAQANAGIDEWRMQFYSRTDN